MIAVYLTPRATFNTLLRSDTLWGMLLVALKTLYSEEKVLQILNECENGNPPFVVSSAFPFRITSSKRQLYFPIPLLQLKRNAIPRILNAEQRRSVTEHMTVMKKFKKIKFFPQEIFQQLLLGELSAEDFFEKFRTDTILSKELINAKYSTTDVLHASLDRLSNSTLQNEERGGGLFYTHEYSIPNGGCFFLVQGETELVAPALRFLQHFGFGGDNSVGKGIFDVTIEDFSLSLPENPTHFISLSLYSPTADELSVFRSSKAYWGYTLELRRGKIGTHFYNTGNYEKKTVTQFSEGSLFPFISKPSIGTVHTVHVDSTINIRHNGFAFPIPYLMKDV